jgi:hypothetical protein
LFKFDCLYSYNSDLALFYFSAVLLVLELSVLTGLILLHRNGENESGMLGRVIGILLLLTYLIYPFGCKVLFSTFNCINVDGVRYLRADMGIDCASPGHHSAEALAGFMIFAFSVGLPLLYFGMLWINRKKLFATDGSNQLAFLRFFYREYDEKLYYWVSELRATGRLYFDTNRLLDAEQETVECIRKSLLMGFASFFQVRERMESDLALWTYPIPAHSASQSPTNRPLPLVLTARTLARGQTRSEDMRLAPR